MAVTISIKDKCPCGSAKLGSQCCWRKTHWHKTPAIITPALPITNFAHPKCYAHATNDCSKNISREHYISNILLDNIAPDKDTVLMTGLTWFKKGLFTKAPKSLLVSKILCERHNNSMSPLDNEIGKLNSTFERFDKELRSGTASDEIVILSGEDIQNWMLKCVCGFASANQIPHRTKKPIPQGWIDILFEKKVWPERWGLYLVNPAGTVHHYNSFAFEPHLTAIGGEVGFASFYLNNFEFRLYLMSPMTDQNLIHRINCIAMNSDKYQKGIMLTWANPKYTNWVGFQLQGIYSGEPPSFPQLGVDESLC